MAVRIIKSSGDLSTVSTTRCEAFQLADTTSYTLTTTPLVSNLTFANNNNVQGVCIHIHTQVIANGTLTMRIKEGSTIRASGSVVISAANGFTGSRSYYLYIPFTAPYAVTTAAGTWTLEFVETNNNEVYLGGTPTNQYFYAIDGDASTTTATSGDSLILAEGYTLKPDTSFTYGDNNGTGLVLCRNSAILNANPTTTYSHAFNGLLNYSWNTSYKLGSVATPLTVANRQTIDISGAATRGSWLYTGASSNNGNATGAGGFDMELYGTNDDYMSVNVSSNAASGQKVINVDRDMTAYWNVNDYITIYGKNKQTTDTVEYQISAITSTTVTVSVNLDYTVFAHARILNRSRAFRTCCFYVNGGTSRSTSMFMTGTPIYNSMTLIGGYFLNAGFHTYNGGGVIKTYSCTKSDTIQGCMWEKTWSGASTGNMFWFYAAYGPTVAYTLDITNCHYYCCLNQVAVPGLWLQPAYNVNLTKITCKNCNSDNKGNITLPVSVNVTGTDIVLGGTYSASVSYDGLYLIGSKCTFTDVYVFGGYSPASINCAGSTFTNCHFNCGTRSLQSNGGTGTTFINCGVGDYQTGTAYDLYVTGNAYLQWTWINSTIGAKGVSSMASVVEGAWHIFQNYNTTANDHRGFYKYGYHRSTGALLTDTNVHTAGGLGLGFESISNGTTSISFTVPIPTNLSGLTRDFGVWCRINKEAYWATTYSMPRMTITYDNGSTVYAQAAMYAGDTAGVTNSGWQYLVVPVIFATSAGSITITLSMGTSATGTNSYVEFDDFSGGNLVNTSLDAWANGLPVSPAYSFLQNASDMWSAATATNWGTNTMGELEKQSNSLIKAIQ